MADLDDIRRICREFPGVIESEAERFGFGVLVKGKSKGFVWTWLERVHPRKARVINEAVVAIRTPNLQAKQMLLESDMPGLFTEPHYDGYPAVLVRLDEVQLDDLRDLLYEGWQALSPPAR
jgi:hypothetical protein